MTAISFPNADVPVYVGAHDPNSGMRLVQVCRTNGTVTGPEPCGSHREFEHLVHTERADVDVADPAQVYWADHPGEWAHRH